MHEQKHFKLVEKGDVRVSAHGYDELIENEILVKDAMFGISDTDIIEDYAEFPKGQCVLVLQKDTEGKPIHVVWGIPKGSESPAVLITAYRPDRDLWTNDFMRRKA